MANFTKQAIKSSFMKLLNQQPLSKISVRDIVEDCGINRNSFYYHFQDIPSLIEEIIKEDADRIIEQHPTVNSLRECINIMFRYALENKKAVLHIYNSANRDIYEKSMMKLCEYVVTKYLETAFGKDPESEKARASAIIFFKCELFGLSFEWIEKGMKEDAIEEIYSLADLCRDFSDEIMKRSKEMNKADNN
ncbi:MAG: TetR family transcriptional regulator [Clostridiales bacterium]|nr:TetR family transcriptional regulator [Clostridiales bacterium]